jgi:single-stranded-DNA-specific exonuclease
VVAVETGSVAAEDELAIDAEVRLADISTRSVTELEQLGPFGMGNRRPILAASRVELAGPPRKMGEGERHLSLTLRQYGVTIRAVALRMNGPTSRRLRLNFSVCFQLVINRFNGQEQ